MTKADQHKTQQKEELTHISGSGMDRIVKKKRSPLKTVLYVGAATIFIAGIFLFVSGVSEGRSFKVGRERITINEVKTGTFEDFIPLRGRVTPLKTVFLDAIEGGRVERVLKEDGAVVEAGELLVALSNTALQLDVSRNEALVTEQLNNIRTIELQLEQNRLSHKRNLIDFNHNIRKLTRQVERQAELIERGAIAKSTYEDTKDDLAYNISRRDITLESQKTDARLQEQQLAFLKQSGEQLENNLKIARDNLSNLNVRAPVSGKLSGFSVEIGQSISRGGRLGQIDDPNNYKLSAFIDEFYLGRVDIDQSARLEHGGSVYNLRVAKIYPEVRDGQFEIDLEFIGDQPADIRRGQTLQARLTLGDATTVKLIPNGAFYQDTGGNWIFVVTPDGSAAVRRVVKMGRRNSRFIEVLDGLDVGERVVTSPYTSYRDIDRLKLSDIDN